MVVIAWISILSGFASKFGYLSARGEMHFSVMAYVHIITFSAWMLLFTVQLLLIRSNKVKFHKILGIAGAVLAGVMVIVGVMTALASEGRKFGTSAADTAFLSLLLGDLLAFIGPTAGGIVLRKFPSDHKRLMLIGTIALLDAGFARYISPMIATLWSDDYWTFKNFNDGFLSFFTYHMICPFLMIVAIGVYDITTRGRLLTSYVIGVIWYLVVMLTSGWLYFSPTWLEIAKKLIGH